MAGQGKKRIMSGMRPTGRLHLGNLLGALDNWVKLQDEYLCFYGIVDWHALTTAYEDTAELKEQVRDMAIDWLCAGLDPGRSVLFVQSRVKEHAELHLLLSMVVPVSWLERVPTYKDQVKQLAEVGKDVATYGFLGYPVLQAADILIYKAEVVPVGEDQLPHLELTREIARRFNHLYAPIFPEPQARLNQVRLLPGTDGRKMSKSYGNDISMTAGPEEIRERVMSMVTDPARVRRYDPGNPEVCTVYAFQKAFNPEGAEEYDRECRRAGIGCVDCKQFLATRMADVLAPLHEKRQDLEQKPALVDGILADGSQKAREYARVTIEEVREVIGI